MRKWSRVFKTAKEARDYADVFNGTVQPRGLAPNAFVVTGETVEDNRPVILDFPTPYGYIREQSKRETDYDCA